MSGARTYGESPFVEQMLAEWTYTERFFVENIFGIFETEIYLYFKIRIKINQNN